MNNLLKNLSVTTKIVGNSIVLLALLTASSGYAFYSMARTDSELESIVELDTHLSEKIVAIKEYQLVRRFHFERALRFGNLLQLEDIAAARFTTEIAAFDKLSAKVDHEIKQAEEPLEANLFNARKTAPRKEFEHLLDAYRSIETEHADFERAAHRVFILLADGRPHEAEAFVKSVEHRAEQVVDKLNGLLVEIEQITERAEHATAAHERTTIQILGAAVLTVILLGLLTSWLVARAVVRPLHQAVAISAKIASGDLDVAIDSNSGDETGQLMRAMQEMVHRLNRIVGDLKGVTRQVASGNEVLSTASQQMSLGATQQAASLEQVTSSMDGMAANIRQSASNANRTEQIAQQLATDAERGEVAVNEAIEAMRDITAKAPIIEEIVRHANLLALNAAIEAARAGEHGKGFAVVASELRKLAERSQIAASEIGERSSSTLEGAEEAGRILDRLVPDTQRAAELLRENCATAHGQDTGIVEITRELQRLDQLVQQSAAVCEEMASNSEELSSRSEHLRETMAFFKLENPDFSPGGNPAPQAQFVALRADVENTGIRWEPDVVCDDEPSAIVEFEVDVDEQRAVAGGLVRY
jgi:methyl-accepting chemotaxis protein